MYAYALWDRPHDYVRQDCRRMYACCTAVIHIADLRLEALQDYEIARCDICCAIFTIVRVRREPDAAQAGNSLWRDALRLEKPVREFDEL